MDLPALAALAVVAGAVVTTASRDGRAVIGGLWLASAAAALVTSPAPGFLVVAARGLGALAVAYLLWVAVATGRGGRGSAIGLPAEAALAGAAFIIGLAIRPVDPLAGPAVAQAAGLALLVLSLAPLAGRDVFRLGTGTMLLTLGCSLLLAAWSGPTPPLQHEALAALLIGIAGATALLAPELPAEVAAERAPAPAPVRAPAPAPVPARAPAPAPTRAPLPPAPGPRPATPAPRRATSLRPGPTLRSAAPPRPAGQGHLWPGEQAEPAWPDSASAPARPEPARPARPARPAWPDSASAPAQPEPAQPEPDQPEPPSAPRAFTADPAAKEWDAWAAWHTPEPESKPRPRSTRRSRPSRDKDGNR
jgi:hypothetical protein